MTDTSRHADEVQLLLTCARGELDSSDRLRIAALVNKNLDWKWLLEAGKQHAVLPMLASCLTEHGDQVPSESLDALRAFDRRNAAGCLQMTRELVCLWQLLSDNDIPMIAFKGPALSLCLYDSCCRRQYGDLDLLIHPADLGRTVSVMKEAGYRLDLTPAEQRYFLQRRYHFALVHSKTGTSVEVHWAFTPSYWPFPLDSKRLWNSRSTLLFQGHDIPCLSAEHRLLVLCAHGAKERWARLQLISDLHALIARGVDWAQVLAEADRMGRQRVLYLGLALARDMLGTRLPREVNCRIENDVTVGNVVCLLREKMFDRPAWPLKGLTLHRYFFRVWPRWRDRIGYVRDRASQVPDRIAMLARPAAPDRRFIKLPRSLRFLHYFVRPLRLALEYRTPRRVVSALLQRL